MKKQVFTPHDRRDMRQASRMIGVSYWLYKLPEIIDKIKEIDTHADATSRLVA